MSLTTRAYALIEIKSVDESRRILRGMATTPTVDRVGDIVDPLGVKFKNPMPFLWQHDSEKPIGTVKFEKPSKSGIAFEAELPVVDEPGTLRDRIDEAWQSMKLGLVRAVSIGFRAIEYSFMESGGIHFIETEVYELSAVTIPANSEAVITSLGKTLDAAGAAVLKRFDTQAPAASGLPVRVTRTPAPASGMTTKSLHPKEGLKAMKVGAQIAALEAQRKAKAEAMEALQKSVSEAGRTKDAEERAKFDELRDELKTLDAEIADLRHVENLYVETAKPVEGEKTEKEPSRRTVPAAAKKTPDPGIRFAQLAKVKAVSRIDGIDRAKVAEKMYGHESEIFAVVKANEVAPGTNTSGNWAADLISTDGAIAADFAEYLRPATIIGKFGQGGIPALRQVPFRRPLVIQTGGGSGYWVGEAKPKPMTAFDYDRSTLEPLKCATIAVLSMENIRDSSPSSDAIVRDELRRVLVSLQDAAFIDPTNAGTANVKPASVLNGASAIAATSYSDETDVILDVRSLLQKFIDANNPASQAVLIMQEGTALSAGLILNALGQRAFPGLTMKGGELLMIPVITSENVADGIVGIVNASDIFFGDDGDVTVDMSTEASLEMKSVPTQDPLAPGTGASLVSLWQNNLVGFRAERTVNWKRRRTSAAAYLTGVAWGGAVNVS